MMLRATLLTILCLSAGCRSLSPEPTPPSATTTLRFRDVTQEAGLTLLRQNGAFGRRWMPETMGGGGAFLDYDQDGWQDILILNNPAWPGRKSGNTPDPAVVLYRNMGNGRFRDVTREAGLYLTDFYGMGVAVGDYDNDGYDDLFLTAVGRGRLFHNISNGAGSRRFIDVTASSGIDDRGWSSSVAWLDYNRDGRLDLFVGHYLQWSPETDLTCGVIEKTYCRPQEYPGETCRLYRNEGRGRFRDVTREAGIFNPHSKALGICIDDIDDDGWPDILVANDMEPNTVYRNTGRGRFVEVGLDTGIALDDNGRARAGMGIDVTSIPPARRVLTIGNFCFEALAFYERTAPMIYQERSRQVGLHTPSYPYITFGLFFADFNQDTRPDLLVTNGHIEDNVERTNPGQSYPQPVLLFEQQATDRFVEVGQTAGLGPPMVGRGACRGDFDNDGRPDILLIPNVGALRLLRNETRTDHHWIGLRLIGRKSNRNAYGARVEVHTRQQVQEAMVRSGSSYLSAQDTRLLFGLGTVDRVERVVIHWPSGARQTLSAPQIDRYLTVAEP